MKSGTVGAPDFQHPLRTADRLVLIRATLKLGLQCFELRVELPDLTFDTYSMAFRFMTLLVLSLACATMVLGFYHSGALIRRPTSALLRMSVNEFGREPPKPAAENAKESASAPEDGSVEEPPARKQEISDEMRRRLIREVQSQGGDANVSAGNPILVISGIIALLVILGGKGFFY